MAAKGRILFVDDDPLVLEGWRGQAARLGGGWEATFVDSGSQGLQAFAQEPFDLVVCDLLMPGMGGDEFLQEIMARYPATIRFLLADPADQRKALHSLSQAHQFLVKPCDLGFLKSVADFAYRHGQRVGNSHVRELVARIGQLPAVPDLYREISVLLQTERGSADQLGEIIGKDPAMTAMILKLANSAFFSLRQGVASPAQAVSYLGIDLLKALVLAHGLFGQVGAFRIPGFSLQQLWRHCLKVAAACKRLADSEPDRQAVGECFTAGLLHDIGILILASRFPEDYARVLDIHHRSGGTLEASEFHIFGATHPEVGAYLLALWGLPEPVVQATAWHHDIGNQPRRTFSAALAVHAAVTLSGDPEHEIFAGTRLNETYLAGLGLLDRLPIWRTAIRAGVEAL